MAMAGGVAGSKRHYRPLPLLFERFFLQIHAHVPFHAFPSVLPPSRADAPRAFRCLPMSPDSAHCARGTPPCP